jgi:hypothetical protein
MCMCVCFALESQKGHDIELVIEHQRLRMDLHDRLDVDLPEHCHSLSGADDLR